MRTTKNNKSNASIIQKPKLTGWAQAASKNITKTGQPPILVNIKQTNGKPTSGTVTVAEVKKGNNSASTPTRREPEKAPFNSNEVKEYMSKLFAQYSSQKKIILQDQLHNQKSDNMANGKDSSNWDSVSSNKNKNKKYGCLNEVAKALRA